MQWDHSSGLRMDSMSRLLWNAFRTRQHICKRMEQAVPQIQCHGIQGPFEAGFVDKAREHLVSYCLIQEETFFGHVDMDNADAESSKSTSRARESESGPLTPRQRAKTPVRQAAISLSDVRLDQARLDKVCSGWQIWGIITDRCIRISSYLSRNT